MPPHPPAHPPHIWSSHRECQRSVFMPPPPPVCVGIVTPVGLRRATVAATAKVHHVFRCSSNAPEHVTFVAGQKGPHFSGLLTTCKGFCGRNSCPAAQSLFLCQATVFTAVPPPRQTASRQSIGSRTQTVQAATLLHQTHRAVRQGMGRVFIQSCNATLGMLRSLRCLQPNPAMAQRGVVFQGGKEITGNWVHQRSGNHLNFTGHR